MPSNHLILCLPLLLLPSVFPSIRLFSNESALCIRWQNIGVSPSTSVLPMNTQDWFPLEWTGWIPCSPRDSQEFSPTPQYKSINSSVLSFLYSPTLMTTGKTIVFTRWTFVGKVMPLLFNMISRLEKVMAPHSNTLAWKIPWTEGPGRLQSMGSHRVGHDWNDFAAAADWS